MKMMRIRIRKMMREEMTRKAKSCSQQALCPNRSQLKKVCSDEDGGAGDVVQIAVENGGDLMVDGGGQRRKSLCECVLAEQAKKRGMG